MYLITLSSIPSWPFYTNSAALHITSLETLQRYDYFITSPYQQVMPERTETTTMTTKTLKHPITTLNERLEVLRHCLIAHFGGADEVPQAIKEAYLAAAVCGVELAGLRAARAAASDRTGIRA